MEVLAALVVSLRGQLAQAQAELGRALERIAEIEARPVLRRRWLAAMHTYR